MGDNRALFFPTYAALVQCQAWDLEDFDRLWSKRADRHDIDYLVELKTLRSRLLNRQRKLYLADVALRAALSSSCSEVVTAILEEEALDG